jgi:hypothetical protein
MLQASVPSTPPSQPPHSEPRRAALPGALLVVLLVVAWFSPWWGGGRVLAPLDITNHLLQPWRGDASPIGKVHNHFVTDAVTQYLPYRLLAERSYREDGYVGWNPLQFGGLAQHANTMALYYDWTMQLHRWLDFWTAWHLGLAGQFLIAGLGMYAFLGRRGIHPPVALAAAAIYMGNSQFVSWIYHRWALGSFCWMPWVLWAIESHFQHRRRGTVLVPVFTALAFLGGSLQHAAFVVLGVAAVWAARLFAVKGGSRWRRSGLAWFVAWGALALGLAAFMFAPCVAAYLQTVELGTTRGVPGYELGITQPIRNLLAVPLQVFPWILGRPATLDLWKALASNLMNVAWFGALPTLCALLAIFLRGVSPGARLLVLLGTVLPLTPLVSTLYHRVSLLFVLGGCWAFAEIVQRGLISPTVRRACAAALAVGGVIWAGVSVFVALHAAELQAWSATQLLHRGLVSQFGQVLPDWLTHRAGRFLQESLIWNWNNLLALALLCGSWALVTHWSRLARARWLLPLALACEVSLRASSWVTFADPGQDPAYPASPLTHAIQEAVGEGVLHIPADPSVVPGLGTSPFPPNTLVPYGVATVYGYESILPPMLHPEGPNPDDPNALGRLGVTHALVSEGRELQGGWHAVWRGEGYALLSNPHAWPRHAGFESAESVGNRSQVIPVRLLAHTANRRELNVPAGVRLLRVAENWHARWKADGPDVAAKEAIQLADGSMGFRLHGRGGNVILRYDAAPPPWARLASGLSVIGVCLLGARGPGQRLFARFARRPAGWAHGGLSPDGEPSSQGHRPGLLEPADRLGLIWVLGIAAMVAGGWGLSWMGRLGQGGWVGLGVVTAAAGLAPWVWRAPGPAHPAKVLRHPLTVLCLLLLVAVCVLYPPTTHDSLSYRLPRLPIWLQAGQIVHVPSPEWRLNVMTPVWELVALPLFILGNDRFLEIPNILCWAVWLCLLFRWAVETARNETDGVHLALLVATAFCFILQAGRTMNDLFAACLIAWAVHFAWRWEVTRWRWFPVASGIALALAAGTKPHFLVLALPWAMWFLASPSRPAVHFPWAWSPIVVALAIVCSPAPSMWMNQRTYGSFSGPDTGPATHHAARPVAPVLGAAMFAWQAMQPPLFPPAGPWNQASASVIARTGLTKIVPKFNLSMPEVPIVDSASLGIVVSIALLAGVIGETRRRRREGGWWDWKLFALLAGTAGFGAASLGVTPGTIGRSFVGFVVPAIPYALAGLSRGSPRTLRRWAIVSCGTGLFVLVVTPGSPLWPARTVMGWLGERGLPPNVQAKLIKYEQFRARYSSGADLVRMVPASARELGMLSGGGEPLLQLWQPYEFHRRVRFFPAGTSLSDLQASGIQYVVAGGTAGERHGELLRELAESPGWELVAEKGYVSQLARGPELWRLYRRRTISSAGADP